MNNPENIPSHIFDWLASHDFNTLDAAQKQEVLKYITEEEYTELRNTSTLLHSGARLHQVPASNGGKQALMDRFKDKHQIPQTAKPEPSGWNSALFWRAAAIILFLLCGAQAYYTVKAHRSADMTAVERIIDTVYVTKNDVNATPIIIRDTIFVKPAKAEKKKELKYTAAPYDRRMAKAEIPANMDISIVKVEDMGNTANIYKGNSMRDDSLLKQYSFVTM